MTGRPFRFHTRAWDDAPAAFFMLGTAWIVLAEWLAASLFGDIDTVPLLTGLRGCELAGLLLLAAHMRLFACLGIVRPGRREWRVLAVIASFSLLAYSVLAGLDHWLGWGMAERLGGPAWSYAPAGMLIMLALAPLTEELFFRALVYRLFRQAFGMPVAILLSAVCFAMLHGQLLSPQLAGGLIFALAYEWSRNLWIPVLLHAGANAAVLLIGII